jgi:hypothetical protein
MHAMRGKDDARPSRLPGGCFDVVGEIPRPHAQLSMHAPQLQGAGDDRALMDVEPGYTYITAGASAQTPHSWPTTYTQRNSPERTGPSVLSPCCLSRLPACGQPVTATFQMTHRQEDQLPSQILACCITPGHMFTEEPLHECRPSDSVS